MSHCGTTPQTKNQSMTVNQRQPTRNIIKTTVRNFEPVAKNQVLCSPDVSPAVKGAIANGDLLQWDTSLGSVNSGRFTNVAPQNANVTMSSNVSEFFVSNGGNDNGSGKRSGDPLETFQRALYLAGRSDAYEQITFYIKGDINWNPASNIAGYANQSRLRESSFGGNLSRGIIIRGLRSSTGYDNVLTPNANPRAVPSQLDVGTAQATLQFTKDSAYSISKANAYDLNIAATNIIPFYKQGTHFYPVAFDTTAHTTAKRRMYLSVSGTEPTQSTPGTIDAGSMNPCTFPGKVTLNNGGLGADPTNVGFTMIGNVQFVEVHFELQDGVKTPYHVNGEFVILYSMFSKTSGSDGATLELSSLGAGNDHLSTLLIDPTSTKSEGGSVIQIYKSLFKDLTIRFTTPAQIKDCVFDSCIILNPEKCEFTGCTFFNCGQTAKSGVNLGDDSTDYSFRSSIKMTECQFQYSVPETTLFNISDNSSLELRKVVIRPTTNTNIAQITPLFSLTEKANLILDDVKVNGKLNNTASTNASVVDALGSSVSFKDIDFIGGSGTLPLIYTDSSNMKLYDIKDTCSNTGPLLETYSSDVQIIDFVSLVADFTVSSGGVFVFNSSTVKVNGTFGFVIKSTVITTETVFKLINSVIKNFPRAAADNGSFNLRNAITKGAINAEGSDIILSIGNTSPQIDLFGQLVLKDSNCRITCSQTSSATLNYQGANGNSTIDSESSQVLLKEISIDGTGGGGSTALKLTKGSKAILDTVSVNNVGYTGVSTISLDNSELVMLDGNIEMGVANTVPCVDITNSSKMHFRKLSAGGTIDGSGTSSSSIVKVSKNSELYLEKATLITDVAGNSAIVLENSSKVVAVGTNGSPESMTTSGGIATTPVIDAKDNCSISLTDINLVGNVATPGIGVQAVNLCKFFGKILTGEHLSANGSFLVDFNTHVHLQDLDTPGTNFSAAGYTTGGASTQIWSTITGSPFIYPPGESDMSTKWDATKGCVITYDDT